MKHSISSASIISIVVAGTSAISLYFLQQNKIWYQGLSMPTYTPPQMLEVGAWTIAFILGALSAYTVATSYVKNKQFTLSLYGICAACMPLWAYVFFGLKMINTACIVGILQTIASTLLVFTLWSQNKKAAYFFLPFLILSAFATYFNYQIWILNP